MFRGLFYFGGFATLSASAAVALVVAHDSIATDAFEERHVPIAYIAPVETPVFAVKPVAAQPTPYSPERLAPKAAIAAKDLPTVPAPASANTTTDLLLSASLRPPVRAPQASPEPVRTASLNTIQGVQTIDSSELRTDLPVMSFKEVAPTQNTRDITHPTSLPTYHPVTPSETVVSRNIVASSKNRLANNWNSGVYR